MIEQAVILAAGTGSRLGDKSKNKPKGFIDLSDKTLIERSLEIIRACGIPKVLIGTGHGSEWYEKWSQHDKDVTCVFNKNYAASGSLETLCVISPFIRGDVVILESDIIYEEKALRLVLDHPHSDILLASGWTNSGDEVYVQVDENKNLKDLSKKNTAKETAVGEFVGITRLSHEAIQQVLRWVESHGARPTPLHYEDGLVAAAKERPLSVHKAEDLIWAEVDTEEHLDRLLKVVLPQLREREHANQR